MIRKLIVSCTFLLLTSCASAQSSARADACESLLRLKLDHVEVVSAERKSEGHDLWFKGIFVGVPFFKEPASCRVALVLKPSSDSLIKAEVWMPESTWNGKFAGVGNGGFAGSIDYMTLRAALQRNYATASTDTGHEADDKDGRFALGHPEKVLDYTTRAIHEAAVAAKAVITAYYGKPAQYSYFNSGSNGGRQALIEAQRYPEDYDGIEAGCPALYPSSTLASWGWIQQQLLNKPGAYIPESKVEAIAAATTKACDAQDGVADGVIDDPRRCDFKPEMMQCKGEDRDDCLTAEQVQGLRAIYSGPGGGLSAGAHHGFEPGSELGRFGWSRWFFGSKPKTANEYIFVPQFVGYLGYQDANWTMDQFDFARDVAAFDRLVGPQINATNPDLSQFKARGGKLIIYHGWNDPALPPRTTVDYYESIRAKMGEAQADQFVKLYMVPGLQHCFAGPGTHSFGQLIPGGTADPKHNISSALEAWVEKGQAPQAIVAGKYKEDFKSLLAPENSTLLRTRPLCPYPQVARWNGKGSIDQAENFSCVTP